MGRVKAKPKGVPYTFVRAHFGRGQDGRGAQRGDISMVTALIVVAVAGICILVAYKRVAGQSKVAQLQRQSDALAQGTLNALALTKTLMQFDGTQATHDSSNPAYFPAFYPEPYVYAVTGPGSCTPTAPAPTMKVWRAGGGTLPGGGTLWSAVGTSGVRVMAPKSEDLTSAGMNAALAAVAPSVPPASITAAVSTVGVTKCNPIPGTNFAYATQYKIATKTSVPLTATTPASATTTNALVDVPQVAPPQCDSITATNSYASTYVAGLPPGSGPALCQAAGCAGNQFGFKVSGRGVVTYVASDFTGTASNAGPSGGGWTIATMPANDLNNFASIHSAVTGAPNLTFNATVGNLMYDAGYQWPGNPPLARAHKPRFWLGGPGGWAPAKCPDDGGVIKVHNIVGSAGLTSTFWDGWARIHLHANTGKVKVQVIQAKYFALAYDMNWGYLNGATETKTGAGTMTLAGDWSKLSGSNPVQVGAMSVFTAGTRDHAPILSQGAGATGWWGVDDGDCSSIGISCHQGGRVDWLNIDFGVY